MFSACGPRWPLAMKPKPFSPLNHFTVPVATSAHFAGCWRPRTAGSRAAALMTCVEPTRKRKSAWTDFRSIRRGERLRKSKLQRGNRITEVAGKKARIRPAARRTLSRHGLRPLRQPSRQSMPSVSGSFSPAGSRRRVASRPACRVISIRSGSSRSTKSARAC